MQAYNLGVCNGDCNLGTGPSICNNAAPPAVLGSLYLQSQVNGNAIPQGIQVWTVGTTGAYLLVAAGAAGGSYSTYTAGYGIVVSSTYQFIEGQTVAISVGQTPTGCASTGFASGGGGTFISIYSGTGAFSSALQHTPVLVAGGGGGVGLQAEHNGKNAVAGTSGTLCACCTGTVASNGGGGGGGGSSGGIGAAGSSVNGIANAGGGGGFYFKGGDAYVGSTYGGSAFVSSTGPVGGTADFLSESGTCSGGAEGTSQASAGGFGGGGGSWNAGGGGGGYSGGQGSPWSPSRCGGGGGGSYDSTNSDGAFAAARYIVWNATLLGSAPSTYTAGYNTGNGFVYIVPIVITGSCSKCSAGTFSSGAMSACSNCMSGTYSSTSGQSICTPCPAGSYSASVGKLVIYCIAKDRIAKDRKSCIHITYFVSRVLMQT